MQEIYSILLIMELCFFCIKPFIIFDILFVVMIKSISHWFKGHLFKMSDKILQTFEG